MTTAAPTIHSSETNTIELVGLKYKAPPEKPADFDKKFAEIVGINPDTNEPWLRVVWGCDLTKYYGGEHHVWYIDPNGVYAGMPYWILENWCPPTAYDRSEWENMRWGMVIDDMEFTRCVTAMPEPCRNHFGGYGWHQKWDATVDVLGPFPEKGVWDTAKILMDEAGQPQAIEEAYDYARMWKFNFNRKAKMSEKRRVDEYLDFYRKQQQHKKKAEETILEERRAAMAEELAKPYTDPAFNFATDGAVPKTGILESLKEI